MTTNTHGEKPGQATSNEKAIWTCETCVTPDSGSDLTEIKKPQIPDQLTLTSAKTEARLDTRLLAKYQGNKHKAVFQLLTKYKADFLGLGKVPFQKEALPSGQCEKFAALNEDQCFLLLTFSKNTTRVRELKVKLVKAFGEARRVQDLRRTEYLPGYHQLHDQIHTLATGSENEARVHMNVNKLLNKAAGIESGTRARASLPNQSILVVAQLLATHAMQGAPDHRIGYQLAKSALEPLLALTAGSQLAIGRNG